MGPDFLDRQPLWYKFCCNFICLLFLIRNRFFLAGYTAIRETKLDIRPDTEYQKRLDIRLAGKRTRISGRIPDIEKAGYPMQQG